MKAYSIRRLIVPVVLSCFTLMPAIANGQSGSSADQPGSAITSDPVDPSNAVDLIEKCLFFQPDPFFVYGPFECGGEKRLKWLGLDDAKTVVHVVCTMRPDETVRVISFRRASQQERELFQTLVDQNQNLNEEGES